MSANSHPHMTDADIWASLDLNCLMFVITWSSFRNSWPHHWPPLKGTNENINQPKIFYEAWPPVILSTSVPDLLHSKLNSLVVFVFQFNLFKSHVYGTFYFFMILVTTRTETYLLKNIAECRLRVDSSLIYIILL